MAKDKDSVYYREGLHGEPFGMNHIYEMVCHILDLDPAENDGSLEVVRPFLHK